MRSNIYQTGHLYSWGDNNFSQLGLSEDTVTENKYNCNQTVNEKERFFIKPVQNQMFGKLVYEMAAGNVSSLITCIDENKSTFMVAAGCAITEKEGIDECEENLITLESS